MKVLIAIVSCHTMRDRQQAIRDTWLANVPSQMDYRFFLGRVNGIRPYQPLEDEVCLDVDDSYKGLPSKTRAICKWALENGYSFVFKCDDDVYVDPKRLWNNSDFAQQGDYIGRKRGPSGGFYAPYCSGFSYWLSARAMKLVADTELTRDIAEDRWVGNLLQNQGIHAVADYRYVVIDSRKNALSHTEGPRVGNTVISACEFSPSKMVEIHKQSRYCPSERAKQGLLAGEFTRISVLIKTFLRDGFLLKCVEGIRKTMPGAKVIIVDDGHESSFKISWYANLRRLGHLCQWLPFDSGFGAKANEGTKNLDRQYVLIGSDDFNFENPSASQGILDMQMVLDNDPSIDVVSGRVGGRPYEAQLFLKGDRAYERSGFYEERKVGTVAYSTTDLTVNYSLIRKEVFDKVRWDEDVKIGGGEHGAFYLDLMKHGFKVAVVPTAHIYELKPTSDWSSAEYPKYRARAREMGRICLKRRGVNFYHCMDGRVETT